MLVQQLKITQSVLAAVEKGSKSEEVPRHLMQGRAARQRPRVERAETQGHEHEHWLTHPPEAPSRLSWRRAVEVGSMKAKIWPQHLCDCCRRSDRRELLHAAKLVASNPVRLRSQIACRSSANAPKPQRMLATECVLRSTGDLSTSPFESHKL